MRAAALGIVAALLLAGCGGTGERAAERWALIGEDNGATSYVDTRSTMKKDGGQAFGWYRTDLKGGGRLYTLLEFRCRDRMYRDVRTVCNGEELIEIAGPGRWCVIVPESTEEKVYDEACKPGRT